MKIYKSTYELLIPVIAAIVGTVGISGVVDNGVDPVLGHTYTLSVCNSGWATKGFPLTIQGSQYLITNVEPNISITVSGTVLPTVGAFELYRPKFYHGTVNSTATDLARDVNNGQMGVDKLPMIWLREPLESVVSLQDFDAVLRTSQCDLYFAISEDFAQYTNDDRFTYAVKPMKQLAQAFIDALNLSGVVDPTNLKSLSETEYAILGTVMQKDGSSKNVFNMNLSGYKMSISIPFVRNQGNCC